MGISGVTTTTTHVASATEGTGAAASQVPGATSEVLRQCEQLAAEMSRFPAPFAGLRLLWPRSTSGPLPLSGAAPFHTDLIGCGSQDHLRPAVRMSLVRRCATCGPLRSTCSGSASAFRLLVRLRNARPARAARAATSRQGTTTQPRPRRAGKPLPPPYLQTEFIARSSGVQDIRHPIEATLDHEVASRHTLDDQPPPHGG